MFFQQNCFNFEWCFFLTCPFLPCRAFFPQIVPKEGMNSYESLLETIRYCIKTSNWTIQSSLGLMFPEYCIYQLGWFLPVMHILHHLMYDFNCTNNFLWVWWCHKVCYTLSITTVYWAWYCSHTKCADTLILYIRNCQ